MTKAQHYDAIVVGLGGVGSFALRALAKESSKHRYLGIELGSFDSITNDGANGVDSTKITQQQENCHTEIKEAGYSSRGLTRIYRRAYFEHANYVPWIEYSLSEFREMERCSGISLMKECGMLLIEPALQQESNSMHVADQRKALTGQQLPSIIASSLNSARLHNIPVDLLDSTQLKKRFPQFNYGTNNMLGLLEPGGGLLRPERIMKVALQEAMSTSVNVTVVDKAIVSKIKDFKDQGIVEVSLLQEQNDQDNGATIKVVTTNKLLVSMGAWTGGLIPSWDHFLHPIRQVQGWIDTNANIEVYNDAEQRRKNDKNLFSSQNMPSFVYISPDWPEAFYGVPCDDEDNADEANDGIQRHRNTWLKVGIHKQDISQKSNHSSIDDHHYVVASSSEILELKQIIPLCINKAAWGNADKQVHLVETKPCLYTMTPDKHFVIGEVSKNIFCVAGLSGHGFKMTPSLGQMMADFALGKNVQIDWNVDFCSPDRFK